MFFNAGENIMEREIENVVERKERERECHGER